MWQRWNQNTHIFEKSTDNGAIWTPLGLNASVITEGAFAKAQLPASVAYEDEPNQYTGRQHILGGSGTAFNTAPIEIQMANYPRIAFHWPGVVASQIGIDTAGTITAYDNPGTGYAPFRAGGIYSTDKFYEQSRSQALGVNYGYSYATYDWTGQLTGTIYVSLVGHTATITVAASGTLSAGWSYLRMSLPIGSAPPFTFSQVCHGWSPGTGWVPGVALFQVNQAFVEMYWGPGTGAWPTGSVQVRLMCSYPTSG